MLLLKLNGMFFIVQRLVTMNGFVMREGLVSGEHGQIVLCQLGNQHNIMSNSTPTIVQLHDQLKQAIVGKTPSASTIIGILLTAMQLVEQYPNIDKKRTVIILIDMILDDVPMSTAERDAIKAMVPPAIDTIVTVGQSSLFKNSKCKWCC